MSDPVPDSFFPFPSFTLTGAGPARWSVSRPQRGSRRVGLSFGTAGTITSSERTFEEEVEADGQSSLT